MANTRASCQASIGGALSVKSNKKSGKKSLMIFSAKWMSWMIRKLILTTIYRSLTSIKRHRVVSATLTQACNNLWIIVNSSSSTIKVPQPRIMQIICSSRSMLSRFRSSQKYTSMPIIISCLTITIYSTSTIMSHQLIKTILLRLTPPQITVKATSAMSTSIHNKSAIKTLISSLTAA